MEVIINNIELDNVFVCRLIFLLIYSISIQFIIFVWQCVSLIVHSYSIIILFIQVKNIIIQASICIVVVLIFYLIYKLNFKKKPMSGVLIVNRNTFFLSMVILAVHLGINIFYLYKQNNYTIWMHYQWYTLSNKNNKLNRNRIYKKKN